MNLEIELIANLLKNGFNTVTMHRINMGFCRGYVKLEPFIIFSGLTGALDAATFKGNVDVKVLGKWRDNMFEQLGGKKGHDQYLNSMSDFGTLCHQALVKIKENGKLIWAEERDYAREYFIASAKKNEIAINENTLQSQIFEYQKVCAALLQFFYDNVQDVFSIEGMCYDNDLLIATPIDIVCRIKEKKGESIVSINLKTSGQITDHHIEQCVLERYLWNKTYPDLQCDKTAILRPKDWNIKKVPTYEFEVVKAEDEKMILADALDRLMMCKKNPKTTYSNFPSEVLTFIGETVLGGAPQLEVKTMEQLFTESLTAEKSETNEPNLFSENN